MVRIIPFNLKFVLGNKKLNRIQIEKLTSKKLSNSIENAYNNVEYYNRLFKKLNLTPQDFKTKEDLQKIPLTTKKKIVESGNSYISKQYKLKNLKTSQTSGSTGEPFKSYFDKRAWILLKYLSKYRARSICGYSIFKKVVIIEAISKEEVKSCFISKINFMTRKKIISVYDDLENHVKFYQDKNPKIVYGFPSYFLNLIDYLEKNNLKLDNFEKLFTSSELLTDKNRKRIEKFFNCELFDIYGSTETKEIAWECSAHKGYHINEDLFYVEILDDNNNVCKPGVPGKIVVTTFENDAMPLLRYENGDMGTILKEKCSCGIEFKLMKPSHGRIVDYFKLKDGRKISPYELTMSVEGIKGIQQYQIIQEKIDEITLNLKVNSKYEKSSEKLILKKFRQILKIKTKININYIENFNNDSNSRQKFRIVKSNI